LVMAMAPDVASAPAEALVFDEAPVLAGEDATSEFSVVGVADVGLMIQVEVSVAITMVLTSSVDVGLPIEAGRVSIVGDGDCCVIWLVEVPIIVAVMVLAVLGRAFAIPLQIL
jgi:hypothetical protein